ncbi:DMT family transporter [Hahella sp. NBU794]|uniref:DMT family transporter n=1 Tax=Hahella sp. NBU794 TaxID=3422590 RepID=UPI003D6F7FC9
MEKKDLINLLALAGLWGASFLFMRIAAPEFGPVAMVQLRITIAALCLTPIMLIKYRHQVRWAHVPHYIFLGVSNSALPFVLLGFATLHVSAGFTSILNAAVPLWSAIIAALWLGDWLNRWQTVGLLIGFLGVSILIVSKGEFSLSGPTLAIMAALTATLSYGFSANYTKRFMTGVQPMVLAAASQIAAALALAPFTWSYMPQGDISMAAWTSVIVMGVFSTALAYIIFYGLLSRIGPTKTVTVTYLIPVFAMFWGYVILDEPVTIYMLSGCLVVFAGTALTNSLIKPKLATAQ